MARRYNTTDEMRARYERDVRSAIAKTVLWYGGWALLAVVLAARLAGVVGWLARSSDGRQSAAHGW